MKSTRDIYFDTYVCPNFIYNIYAVVCANMLRNWPDAPNIR